MGPLGRRSVGRLVRGGAWGGLVAGAFLLLATAAASVPLFAEASANAALAARLEVVPANVRAAEAPVVRVVGGVGPLGRQRLESGLGDIPGLRAGVATAASIGIESRPKGTPFAPFVAAGRATGATAPDLEDLSADDRSTGGPNAPGPDTGGPTAGGPGSSGWLVEPSRIYGDDDLAHSLVPVQALTRVPAAGVPQVWLPAPPARRLKVAPGDRVQVGVTSFGRTRSIEAQVAGIYAVDADGRLPADRPGSQVWNRRSGELPADSERVTLPAYLVIADVATAQKLASGAGDELVYAIEGSLRSDRPTLEQARATVGGIRRRQTEVRDPEISALGIGGLREQVASGLPVIVSDATEVANRTVAWTRPAGTAGLVLGLLAVLAVAVFGLVRRAVELRHAVGLGVRPVALGTLAVAEVLVVAVVSAVTGLLLGWLLVVIGGPPGQISTAGLTSAGLRAGLAVGAGMLLTGFATTAAALRAAQLDAAGRSARTVPWELVLPAVAVTVAGGLLLRPAGEGPPSPVDLLAPLVVLAAIGAVGARLVLLLAAAGSRALASGQSWSRRPAQVLATRRVAAGGPQSVLLITVLTIGFGFLIYSFAAAASVRQVTTDRSAVLAGARATTGVEVSWLLDPGAAQLPPPPPVDAPPGDDDPDSQAPVAGTRNPPLPPGLTVVWRGRVTVPPEYGNLDLLVVDPGRFAEVASWGTGPELARARAAVRALAADDARVAAQLRAGDRSVLVPALGVGAIPPRAGEKAQVATEFSDIPITVRDVVPAFPGAGPDNSTVVVGADSLFSYLGQGDPRVRPPQASGRFNRPPAQFLPSLWTSRDLGSMQSFLAGLDVKPGISTTYEEVAQEPDIVAARWSTGYQVALGLCVAALAVLGLAMFAERAATRARAADLMLTRMGLGRSGVRRARALELGALALIGLLLAVVGFAVIIPFGGRLLDPGGGVAPAFALRPDPAAVVAAVLAVAVALLLALAVSRQRGRAGSAGSAGEVLRDAE